MSRVDGCSLVLLQFAGFILHLHGVGGVDALIDGTCSSASSLCFKDIYIPAGTSIKACSIWLLKVRVSHAIVSSSVENGMDRDRSRIRRI